MRETSAGRKQSHNKTFNNLSVFMYLLQILVKEMSLFQSGSNILPCCLFPFINAYYHSQPGMPKNFKHVLQIQPIY